MMRITACALLITLGVGSGCESGHRHGDMLEVRTADVEPRSGWTETHRFIAGSKVWMAPEAVVDSSMVQEARPAVDRHGAFVVMIQLNPDGATALAELTSRQQSRPLAILIDGDVVATPLMMSDLDDEFVISRVDWSAEDAAEFAKALNATDGNPSEES